MHCPNAGHVNGVHVISVLSMNILEQLYYFHLFYGYYLKLGYASKSKNYHVFSLTSCIIPLLAKKHKTLLISCYVRVKHMLDTDILWTCIDTLIFPFEVEHKHIETPPIYIGYMRLIFQNICASY